MLTLNLIKNSLKQMLLIQKEKPKKHKNVYKFPMILHLMSHRVKIQTQKRCLSHLNLVHISIKRDPQEKQSLLNSRRGSPDSHTALVTAVGGAWNREMGGASYFQSHSLDGYGSFPYKPAQTQVGPPQAVEPWGQPFTTVASECREMQPALEKGREG